MSQEVITDDSIAEIKWDQRENTTSLISSGSPGSLWEISRTGFGQLVRLETGTELQTSGDLQGTTLHLY